MTTFAIGDRVWLACCSNASVQRPCPICFGTKRVTLILGDGSECRLECDYCAKGYGYPRGFVEEWEAAVRATSHVIDTVDVTSTADATKVEYMAGSSILYADRTFASEAEALAAAVTIAAQAQAENEKRADYGKHDAKKSLSWNAGYHLREAKEARRRIEYHERMAAVCKAKAREDKAAIDGGRAR